MTTSLRILLRAIGQQVLIDLEHPNGEQTSHTAGFPFTVTQLPVLLRALEISRSVQDSFDPTEWAQLEAWGVTSGEFKADHGTQLWVTEDRILIDPLLKLMQEQLYRLLFGTEQAGQLLSLALSRVPPRQALHLQLQLPPGSADRREEMLLSQYPWEVLSDNLPYWPDKRIVISRYLRMPRMVMTPQAVDQLRVLVITARPGGLEIGEGSDAASMVTGLRRRLSRYPVQVRELPQATFNALSDYLYEQQTWNALHFDGHGDFGRCCPNGHLSVSASIRECRRCGEPLPDSFSGYLAFEREDGSVDWVSAESFAELLLDHGLRLVVLNTCSSALARRGKNVFNGVAQSLIQAGIPAVVATPFRLDWEAAVEFARYLYQHLGQGEGLVEALDHSRRRLRHRRPTPREWYRPVLYLREDGDSRGLLFEKPTDTQLTAPDLDKLRTLHIYSFQPPPQDPPERAFFWQRYFDKNRHPQRATPDPNTWERELLPELQERKEEIGQPGPIFCPTRLPLSVALAIGHVFPRVGGFRLAVMQTPPNYWFSDTPPPPDPPFQPAWAVRTAPGQPDSKEAALVIYAVNRRDPIQMVRQVGAYWQEPDTFAQLADPAANKATGLYSRRFRQVILLRAEPAVTEDRFLLDWEIAELAQASRPHLDRLVIGVDTGCIYF